MIELKLSARNRFSGVVESVQVGVVTATVKVKITKPITITAVITKESIEDLKIKKGDKVEAIIKSTEIIIAKE